jgi:TolA-binding protein
MLTTVALLVLVGAAPLAQSAVLSAEASIDGLVDEGFDKEAIARLRELVRASPAAPRRPVWQAKILRAVARGGDVDAFAHEAAQLATDILAERQKRPPSADLAEAEALAETLLTQRLTTWHVEHASVTRSGPATDAVFRLWFSLFDDRQNAGDMHFFHGELLWALQQPGPAADAYEASVLRSPHGRWAEAAAEWAMRMAGEAAKRPHTVGSEHPLTPQPLSPAAIRLVRVSDAYAAAWPAARYVPRARFQAARALYDAGHLDDASARFLALIAAAPASAEAEIAANLVLDIDALRDDRAALAEHARLLQRYASPPAFR